MLTKGKKNAYFHLPGLFEFYEFYRVFLPIFQEHREYFYPCCQIGSIYGASSDCIWAGGRVEFGEQEQEDIIKLLAQYGISARLTFSNSMLKAEHLADSKCNALCQLFEKGHGVKNGIIIYSDLLLDYLKMKYPNYYFVSSTTKVLEDFHDFLGEVRREDFAYVVPDFRLNHRMVELSKLSQKEKDKVEFLCNECCSFGCKDRKICYQDVSRKNLGEPGRSHVCRSADSAGGYRFSKAMKNPGFISLDQIHNIYLPMGFSNFKIEGRGLGSALLLEFILYYMTKPEYHIHVREEMYLENTLDLF